MVILRAKVAIVGDATVGKSALTQMAFSGGVAFPKNYIMTMGCDFCVKEFPIDRNTTVELSIFDIAGQDLYRHNIATYLEQLDAVIFVYDVTVKTSFEAIGKWLTLIRKTNPNICMVAPGAQASAAPGSSGAASAPLAVLIANKIDMKDKAEVQEVQGEVCARNNKMVFFQASALRGVGTMEPLMYIAKETAAKYEERARVLSTM